MQSEAVLQAIENQRKYERKRFVVLSVFCLILVISFVLDIMTGPSMLDASRVLYAIFEFIGLPFQVDASTQVIVTNLRLPIALMAIIVGGSLGVGGAEMQT